LDIFSLSLWSKILTNITLMFSLTILIISANKVGLLEYLYMPLKNIKSSRIIMLAWFMIATILSAFTLDLTLALILTPIVLFYADSRGLSKVEILLATTWGNMVGSEWTYFGGGDTIIGWTLLEQFTGERLDILTWGSLFWLPSFLSLVGTAICLLMFIKNTYVEPQEVQFEKPSLRTAIIGVLSILGIIGALTGFSPLYMCLIALTSLVMARLGKDELKNMPLKGVYIWTFCIIIGSLIGNLVKSHYQLILPEYLYSFAGIVLILTIICGLTNIMTNTGLTTIILPLVMASQFVDKIWLYVLVTKAISMCYLTIFANSGLAVSSSYGLSQKDMFFKGLLVVLVQLAIFSLYFYFMRGYISIY